MFRRKFKISFDIHKFCFSDGDGDDDNDDDDGIAIVHGLKSEDNGFPNFIRVLHGIAWYCVVLHVTGLHWY